MPADGSWSLNPVVEVRRLFESLPTAVRRPIELVVFGGDLPRADVSGMRWMAAELRAKAAAMNGHAEDAKTILTQEDSLGALGDRVREMLQLHHEGAARLREEALALADQAHAAANDAEKTLCVMFAFGVELAWRIIRTISAAAAAGPAGQLAAAPLVESMLIEGRGKVALMRAGLEQAYKAGAATTAARLSAMGPYRLALTVGTAAALPAGVDLGAQLMQVASGDRNSAVKGPNGENPRGIDLKSIEAAAVSGAGGALGGMAAGVLAPKVFPRLASSRAALGLVQGLAGAGTGLGAAALITGWPENFEDVLASLLSGGFAGVVDVHGRPHSNLGPSFGDVVDGSGAYVPPDPSTVSLSKDAVLRLAGAPESTKSLTLAPVDSNAYSQLADSAALGHAMGAGASQLGGDLFTSAPPGPTGNGQHEPDGTGAPARHLADSGSGAGVPASDEQANGRTGADERPGQASVGAQDDPAADDAGDRERGAQVGSAGQDGAGAHDGGAQASGASDAQTGDDGQSGSGGGAQGGTGQAGGAAPGAGGGGDGLAGGGAGGGNGQTDGSAGAGGNGHAAEGVPGAQVGSGAASGAALAGVGGDPPDSESRQSADHGEDDAHAVGGVPSARAPGGDGAAGHEPTVTRPGPGQGKADPPVEAGNTPVRNGPGGEAPPRVTAPKHTDLPPTHEPPGLENSKDAVPLDARPSAPDGPGRTAEQLAQQLAGLPSADPATKRDLTAEQQTQFKAASKKALALYRLRQEELAGESWEQRRHAMEHGDRAESLLRYVDAVREGTGKTPRWNQIEAFLLGEHGFMRQMGTGQGKSMVGALDTLWQLSRGEPVGLATGDSVRVHHVITTTEVLANEGVREFAPMLRGLGYEVARWDPHDPQGAPDRPTVYYMTYDERATAELFDRPPPGKTATIDEADAVLVHNQTVHYQSEGQRELASEVEAAGVYRVRDFLKAVLRSRITAADDLAVHLEQAMHDGPSTARQAGAARTLSAEEVGAARTLTARSLREQPEQCLDTVSRLWESYAGRKFTAVEIEMARAFLDVKAGRLKLNRDFQIFGHDAEKKVQILDEYGKPRSDPKIGTESRWFGGRHKMVEAMFGAPVYSDGTGSKQVTVEDVLGGYEQLHLMSGTLERTAAEIKENFPVGGGLAKVEDFGRSKLVGEQDRIFLTEPEKLRDAVDRVRQLQAEGRPVLVICPFNDLARNFSLMLTKAGVEHNAIDARWFAEHRDNNAAEEHLLSVKDTAGVRGAVTVGTGMLGRGFDVSISDEVDQLGGVHAHMLGRSPTNPDEDHQWSARAGRNGRNGSFCFNVAASDRLYSEAQQHGARVAITHYRTAMAMHAEATAEYAEAGRLVDTDAARPGEAVQAARAKVAATAADVAAAEREMRSLTAPLQNDAADRAYLQRAMRRANQAHAPPTAEFPAAVSPPATFAATVPQIAPGTTHTAAEVGQAAEDTGRTSSDTVPAENRATTETVPAGFDAVQPHLSGDRFARLAGWLGIPASVQAAAAAFDTDDDDDPLSRLLERAGVSSAAVQALNQHLDHAPPGAVLRADALTDEQALDQLMPRRNRLAAELGWEPGQVAAAEGVRRVGAAVDTARDELAALLNVPVTEVNAATARDVLADAVARLLTPAETADDPATELLVFAASTYLAVSALLDLAVAIHQRSPKSCVNNGVTMMRVLYPGNEHAYQMPADLPLRGHDAEDTERAFGGDFRTFRALDEAAESLKTRPGGSQALVYKWMNTKGEVESHLVLLVNDSDRADAPNLVVLDIAAAPGEAPITPADLAAPRALLRKAVPFQQWQREQQPYIEQLDEADRRVFAIEFDSTGGPLAPLPAARRPVVSAQSPGSSPPALWSSRAPPLRRGQFALAGHRTPGEDRTPDSVRAVTPPGIERESEAASRSGEDVVPTGSRPLADPGGRSGEDVAELVAQRFPGVRSPDAEVLARHIDSVGVERFLVVRDAPGDGEPTLWRLPSAREAAALNVRATTRSHSTEAGIAAVEAAERTGAAAHERQIADARWLTHGELDVRIVNRQVQGEFAQRFSSALESFDRVPSPADAAAAIARLGSRLSLSIDDIEQLNRRAAGRPAEEQENLVGYLRDLADEFEINDMTAEVYADVGDRDRLDNCLRTQRIRVALTTHPDILDVISTPMSEVLLFELVRSAHWTGATIGNALEFLVRPQVAAALREIHRNNPHFAPYVARRMSKSTAAELERVGRELGRIAEIPADAVDGRLLDGFGRYVSPIAVGDISRVIAGGSASGDEVTSHDRAWEFLLDLEDFSPGWVRQKFADVFLAAGQIANLPEHVRSEVTFTAQRLREVEDIYLRGSQGGDFTLYVAKVGELPPSQRPPTIRTAMEFAREVTPEFARCLRDLLADGAQGAERHALGLRHTGDAGLRELHKVASSFVNEVKSAVISAESLAKVQSSEFLARLLIDITRYDSSGWGTRGIASLRELLGNHDRAAAAGHIAPMPVEYRPSGVLEVAKLRTRDTDSGPGWTEDLLTRFARLSKNLQAARAALTGVPRPFTYLLGKLGHDIADHVEALERSIRSGTLADGSPMNDVARRNMMSRAQEMKELLAPTTESAQRFPVLRSLRDFEHNFQRLARVGELHDDLRTICFAWAMRRHPEWVDRLENIRADEPTLEDVSLVREFVEHITNQQVFAHYFANRKGANVFRRMTSIAALDEAILRTQGVGVSSDTTKLQFVPTRGPLLELSGHIASACWAGKYPSVAAAMPNMTAVIMVRNPDDPGRTALAGAGLLIETTSASGEPILLVRGLNPSETYINHVSVADFYREFTSWAQGIATARGRRLAIVIDGRAGDAATNRPVLFGHLVAERRKLTPVPLKPGDSEFNGYDVTRCAYLVQPDSAHDEREQRTGPGGLIGSRPSSDPEGAERTTAEAGTPESPGPTVVGELGRLLAEHGVVVGRAAAARVLGSDLPGGEDVVELSIPEWLYRQCEAEGWTPEGDQPSVLTRDRFRVSVGWPGVGTDRVSHEDLADRSWQPAGGGWKVALPADVYAWTQETQDRASADLIKERLLSPAGPPLPAEVIEREIDEVTEILRARVPREQLADPEIRRGIRLAAEGLFANRTLYGHPDVGRANHLHDDALELREFGVAALYHNGMGVAEDLGHIVDNGVLQGADLHEIVWAMVADAWSDLVYGGGRRSDNPDGYDELRSARLLHDRALSHGCGPSTARMLGFAVNGTGFDERTGTQMIASPAAVAEMRQRWGEMTDGEFQTATRVARWVAAADLQTLSEPDAVVRAIELALEDLMSRRFDPARVFGRVLSEWGARVNDVDEALRLADRFGRVPPEGGHITVRQALLERLRGNATFTHPDSGYQPPDGWLPANRDMRRDHAAKLREIADRLASDSLYTPLDAYRDARSHAAEMREKYSGFRWQVVVRPSTHASDPAVLAATIAARLPESDPSGMSRDVIEALPRITEFVSAQATSFRDTGNAAVIVVTSSQDADGRPRLVAQLDYTRPDATDPTPGVTREELRRELSDVDCRIDIETADALPQGQVWHSLRLDFTRQRILVCCGEWGTGGTGMATLNVALCRALAEAGHEVTVRAGEVGRAPRIPGVTVIGHRESGPFASMRERMLSDWDELPPSMDLVIVHDAAGGLAAALAAEERYPAARLVRVNHLTPMLRETLGHNPERGRAKVAADVYLARRAHLVTGLGPVLATDALSSAVMAGHSSVHELQPGLVMAEQPPVPAPGDPARILLFGRADDPLKGVAAVARVVRQLRARGRDARLMVRGYPKRGLGSARAELVRLVGDPEAVEVAPRTSNRATLQEDIRSATVVVMPSRAEGFGLVATEAIEQGVPVVVPSSSGVGRFLAELDEYRELAARFNVVEQHLGAAPESDLWVAALDSLFDDVPGAWAAARRLQELLQPFTGKRSAKMLVHAALNTDPHPRPAIRPSRTQVTIENGHVVARGEETDYERILAVADAMETDPAVRRAVMGGTVVEFAPARDPLPIRLAAAETDAWLFDPSTRSGARQYGSRANILRAFVATVAGKGFGATGIDDVCRRARISRDTFRDHFLSTHSALADAHRLALSNLNQLVVDEVGAMPASDRAARVTAAVSTFVSALAARPATARLLLVEGFAADSGARAELTVGTTEGIAATLATVFGEPITPTRERRALAAAVHGMLADWAVTGDDTAAPALRRSLVDLLRNGPATAALGDAVIGSPADAAEPSRRESSRPAHEAEPAERERILTHLIAVTAEQGYTEMSPETVQRRAGVSHQTYRKLFTDKRTGFEAACAAAVERVRIATRAALPDAAGADVRSRLQTAIHAYLTALAAYPDEARVLHLNLLAPGPGSHQPRDRHRAMLAAHLREVVDEIDLPTARLLASAVAGVVTDRILSDSTARTGSRRSADGESERIASLPEFAPAVTAAVGSVLPGIGAAPTADSDRSGHQPTRPDRFDGYIGSRPDEFTPRPDSPQQNRPPLGAEQVDDADITRPSRDPDPGAVPSGSAAVVPVDGAGHEPAGFRQEQRGLRRQNEAAVVLARAGFQVEQHPEEPGARLPDFRIEGRIFDCYAPATGKVSNICFEIRRKVYVKRQAERIVVNLADSTADPVELSLALRRHPIPNLREILAIDRHGTVLRLLPGPVTVVGSHPDTSNDESSGSRPPQRAPEPLGPRPDPVFPSDVRLLNEAVRDGRGPLRGEHFPVPGLRMRSNDPGRNAVLRLFSLWQAYVANRGLGKLVSRWDSAPAPESRRRLLAQLYFWISQQRYMRQVWAAERDPSVVGEHGESHPDYFRTRLGDDAPNMDMVGRQTGLRAGVRRDPSTGKWRGGVGTPAFWTTLAIGRLVKNRMDAEAPGSTMLQNVVELPGGARVDGNVLYALEHDRFVIETARADDQRTIFDAALAELATALGQRSPHPSPELLRRLANAVYLLFQAPLMTRGSDATIRTFAATVFTFAFGRPLRLPHDIDLQAMSRRQSDFVEWFAGALQRGLRTVGDSEAAGRPHARAATGVDDRPPGFIGSRPREQSDSSLDAARGAWLKALRLEQDRKQKDVAEAAGLTNAALSNIEKGRRTSLGTFQQLCRALGVEAEALTEATRRFYPDVELETAAAAHDSPGGWVAAHRNNRGMTRADLARAVGVTPTRIGEIENGDRPPPNVFYRIARALGVGPQALAEATRSFYPDLVLDLDPAAHDPAAPGNWIAALRHDRDTTQAEVARAAGTSAGYLAGIEGGKYTPNSIIFRRVCRALEVAPELLATATHHFYPDLALGLDPHAHDPASPGSWIVALRHDRDMTGTELSAAIGPGWGHLSGIETGNYVPRFAVFRRICEVMGIDDELLRRATRHFYPHIDLDLESAAHDLGKWITALRHDRDISRAELARVTGLSTKYLAQIETENRRPRLSTFRQISRALGVSGGLLIQAVRDFYPDTTADIDPAAHESLGRWIAALRHDEGMSATELARRARMPRSTLSSIENNRYRPRLRKMRQLCQAQGIGGELLLEVVERFYADRYERSGYRDEEELFKRYVVARVGSPEERAALDEISETFAWVPNAVARRESRDIRDDAVQAAWIGMLGAITSHVPSASFAAHAWASCRAAVFRYRLALRFPDLDNRTRKVVSTVEAQIGRMVAAEVALEDIEIARETGLKVADVALAREILARPVLRLDAPISGKDGSRQREVADPAPAGFSDTEFALTVRAALADLADPAMAEQLVMLHLVEGRSLARTAERLGLGVGAASELLAETAARLRGAFDHREPGDATTSERNRPTPWSTARAQPDQPPSSPVSPGDSAPDEGTTRPGGFIGSRPPEPGDSARGPAPEQTPGTTPWSRLPDRDAHQGVGDEGEVPGTTASPTAAASARVVEFLLGCLTRRDTIYWCQLTPDGLFPEWAWSSDEQLPVLAPDLPISCIDMVVYAAMAAGVFGREQARAIYDWADPDDFSRRWVPELPDLLVPAGRQLLSDHDTAPRPQHGDVVMWFGSVVPGGDERLMHVAVADGEAHRGAGSASVLSFSADCSWLRSQPRRGDAKMSGVELTTIADISDTMLANWSHTVRVEFGPGPWTQPPATGGELRVPPSRESRALRPFNKKNWRRTFPGAAAWVQGRPDAQRWTAAFDEWERAEGAAGAPTRLVELIDAAISSTRIERTLRSPRTSPIDGHPQVAVEMDQDGKPIGLTVASMDGHGRVLRKLFTERPDLLDTIPRHGGRLSIAYDRVNLQTDGQVRGEHLRPEDADRSRERIPGRLLHEYLRLCREGALDKPGTKPGRTPKRPSFERWIATLPPSMFKGAGDSSYATTSNGHILTDRAVEEGCRPPRDNEPDDPHGAMAALRRIVLEAPDDVVGPTPISEQPTPLTERSNEVFELGVMSAHVTVGKDPSGRWRLLERPYAPVHPGDVLTQWCAQLQAGSRRRLLRLIRQQLSGRVVGPEAGPGGYIGSRPTDSDADPSASGQDGPALRAESAASLPSPPDQGRQMPVQGGSGTVDALDGPVPSTAWPPLDGTKPFREWLRAARLARGLTQAQLAAGIGVPNSATYIGSLERGVAITRDMAVRLLAGLGAPEELAEAVLREYFPDEGGEFPDPGSDRFRHPKDWIIAARTSKGLLRSELAARAGVGLTGLSQKERAQYPRGEFGIRPDYALRLLTGLAAPSDIVTAFMSRFYPGWEPDVSADGRRNTGPDGFIGNRPRDDEPEDAAHAGARVPADLIGPVDARAGLPTYSPPDAELRMRADRVLREHWGAGASPDDLVYRWRRSTAKRAAAAAEECAQHAARNARRSRNLGVDELRALVRVWPEFVGKAGGFPKGVRDQANRWAYAKTRIALDTAAATTRLSGRERALREYLLNVEDLLIRAGQRAATVETPGVPTPTVLLERFDTDDPGAGSITISLGSADPVAEAWHVDGTDRDLRRLDQRMQLACNHYEAAVQENPQRPVRVVVWSGTDGHRLAGDLAVSADTGSAPHPAVRPERQLVVYGDGGRPAKKALAHEWVARTTDAVVVCGESNLEAMSDALADVTSSTEVYYGIASRPGASGKAEDVPGIRFTSRFPKGDAGRTNAVLKDVRDRAQRYEKEPFEEGKPIDDEFLLYVDDRTKAPTESLENMGRILAGCPDRVARHNPLQHGRVHFTECIERVVDEQTRSVYADILPRDPHTGTPTVRAIAGDAALARSAIDKRGGPGARPEILSHRGLPDDFTRAGRLAIENKRWWNSLHRDEQRAVVAIHPGIIGNAPGLPSEVANYANDYRRFTTASDIHARGRKNASRAERQVFRNLYAVGEALTRSVTVHRDIPPPVVATVALDPEAFGGNGSGTFVIGNCRLEDADHVVWYVDGVNTRLQSAPARLGSARNLYEELVRADPSVKVAVVCWIGYEAPANYKEAWASRPELAEAGGRLFARDVLALRAVTGARMSKLGYSYGTPVVAEGGVGGRLDGVFEHGVVMGSPGRGRRFDSATDASARRTWVLAQSDDPVTGFGGDAPNARGRLLGDGPLGLGTDPATDIVATGVRAERGFPYSLAPFDGHGEYLQYSLIGAAQPTESLRHAAWCLAGRGDEVPTERHRPTVDNPTAMHRIRARVVDAARDRRAPQLDAALDTPGDHRSRRDLPVPAAGVVSQGDGSPRSGAMQAAGAAVGPSEGTRVGPRLAVRLGKDGLADAGRACAGALVLGVDSIVVEVGRAAGDMAALDMICRSAAHADAALAVELPTGPAWPESEIRAKVAAIAATLRRHGIRGQLHAFDLRVATAGAELAPDWQRVAMVNTLTVAGKGMRGATGWMTRALRPGAAQIDAIIDHARRAGATGLAIPYQLLSENFVRQTTEGGMRLAVWGVTGSGRMRESLRMDVGEIWARKTEDLALLRAEVAESGLRIPEAFAPPPPPDGPPRATPWSGSTGR